MRQVIIYPRKDGYWVAECPSLPGCISQGETKHKAIQNIRKAIQVYIEALEEFCRFDGSSMSERPYKFNRCEVF